MYHSADMCAFNSDSVMFAGNAKKKTMDVDAELTLQLDADKVVDNLTKLDLTTTSLSGDVIIQLSSLSYRPMYESCKNSWKDVIEQKFKVGCVNAGISKCISILKRKKCSEDLNNASKIQKSTTFSLNDNGNNVEEESVSISKLKPQAAAPAPKSSKKVEKKEEISNYKSKFLLPMSTLFPVNLADVETDVTTAGQPKKRTFKKFSYRGVDLDALLDMSTDELVKLFNARPRRRFQRGLKRKPMALIKKLRKAKREAPPGEKPEPVKTHLRNMIIVPEMIGSIIGIYNGKTFNQIEVKPEMIGHYLAEFSISYKPVKHGRPGIGATHSSRFIPLK
ncbi:40S ribosomal protein S15 [Capsicum baccatum]|uniref:40S ribosomal protein S15 n=1 Tax=Capsicum baccatum TaxID=33114 RepID=A0A2G2WJT9_CAPBA|nr:40S ribosomal protein S15 [Capsicum baccatum]